MWHRLFHRVELFEQRGVPILPMARFIQIATRAPEERSDLGGVATEFNPKPREQKFDPPRRPASLLMGWG